MQCLVEPAFSLSPVLTTQSPRTAEMEPGFWNSRFVPRTALTHHSTSPLCFGNLQASHTLNVLEGERSCNLRYSHVLFIHTRHHLPSGSVAGRMEIVLPSNAQGWGYMRTVSLNGTVGTIKVFSHMGWAAGISC